MWRFIALIALLPTSSIAEGTQQLSAVELSKGPHDYFCTGADGRRHELGEVVCLVNNSCSDTWLAKCDMSLNNPMWRKVQDGCPAASLLDRFKNLQPGLDTLPVNTGISDPVTQAS